MRLRTFRASGVLVACGLVLTVLTGAASSQAADEFQYLLVRRAGTPEKNYYEFTPRVVGILDADTEFRGVLDIMTEERPVSIRYGVYRVYRTRVLREADSEKEPASASEGAFVLSYRRDPDLKFCARRYRFENEPSGARKIIYTDYVDGREYSFRMTKDWPRPFSIYVVEVLPSDLLHDVWQRFHRK